MKSLNGAAKRAAGTVAIGIVAGLALLFVAGGLGGTKTASADNGPHKMGDGTTAATDRCAGCHRAHTAKGKDYLFVQGAASLEAFCFSCHNGSGAKTDVVDGTYTDGGGLRAGGFEHAIIDSTNFTLNTGWVAGDLRAMADFNIPTTTPKVVTSGHTMEVAESVYGAGPLGSAVVTTQKTLECTSCHDPHGNGQYRILRPLPVLNGLNGGTASATLADRVAGGVTVADGGCPSVLGWPYDEANAAGSHGTYDYLVSGSCTEIPKVGAAAGSGNVATYATTNYFQVDYVQPTQCNGSYNSSSTSYDANAKNCTYVSGGVSTLANTGLSAWCAQCHQRYVAASSSRSNDSGDANFTYRHTSASTVGAPAAADPVKGTPALHGGSTRQCISCHLTHGSPSTSSSQTGSYTGDLGYPDGDGAAAAGANNRILKMDNRGICLKCHGSDTFK